MDLLQTVPTVCYSLHRDRDRKSQISDEKPNLKPTFCWKVGSGCYENEDSPQSLIFPQNILFELPPFVPTTHRVPYPSGSEGQQPFGVTPLAL